MNERYLFKAKQIDNGKWIKWNAISGIPHNVSIFNKTICQCTGLKDKNGKLIWENDIVEVVDEIYRIEWEDDSAMWTLNQCGSLVASFDNYWSCDVEVIGNKFDNPELLEGGE